MFDIEAFKVWATQYISNLDPSFLELSDSERNEENLFTSGRLDSMALMTYLLESEKEFKFSFTAESFQDRRLQTISGTIKLIEELKSNDN